MKKPTFLRRDTAKLSKLGKGRKRKQKWNKPKGRDNKMREKRRGYAPIVSIGYSKDKKERGKIKGKMPMIVNSLNDLKRVGKGNIVVLGKVGMKKKIELVKKISELKLEVQNLNIKKFLKVTESKEKKKVKKVEVKKTPEKKETKEDKK